MATTGSRSFKTAASMSIPCREKSCRRIRSPAPRPEGRLFVRNEVYWIKSPTMGRLAIMPRPRGGDWLDDEVASLRAAGVDVVLSLLTPGEVAELDLAEEQALCEAQGMQFLSFPILDRSVPSS